MKPVSCGAFAAIGAALGITGGVVAGTSRWKRETSRAVASLTPPPFADSHSSGPRASRFFPRDLDDLPKPVARYLRFALTPGQPLLRGARLEQTGYMRSGNGKPWAPFTAVEHFCGDPIGFVWDASMRIAPFVTIKVRDRYVGGEGASEATIAGLISLGRRKGTPELAAASLVRFLAEAAWLPAMYLPSENLRWSAIDDRQARAILRDGRTEVSIDVEFGYAGEIVSVSTMRYRDVNGVPVLTPWRGHYRAFSPVHGMMIPMAADVEWIIQDVPVMVWRGEITVASYAVQP